MTDVAALRRDFEAALDDLEAAIRECPDDRWEASAWEVKQTDPWMWPAPGVEPIPERTLESIQRQSHFWVMATHTLWYLDQYVDTNMTAVARYEPARGGPEELPFPAADGAAPLPPTTPMSRQVLLDYLDFGRAQLFAALDAPDIDLTTTCAGWHPHAGKTRAELLDVLLTEVRVHGGQLLAFARS